MRNVNLHNSHFLISLLFIHLKHLAAKFASLEVSLRPVETILVDELQTSRAETRRDQLGLSFLEENISSSSSCLAIV